MNILVTAGPTREPIDPVRFISNRSTGKMGYAVARVCVERGHRVTLVSGPVNLQPPDGVRLVCVETAAEMLAAVRKHLVRADVLVMTAAVADFRPRQVRRQKMKKRNLPPVLRLSRTVDILKALRQRKGSRVFVGFAAETSNVVAEACRKQREKGLDLVVANDVTRKDSGFGTETNRVAFVYGRGAVRQLPLMSKVKVAGEMMDWVAENAINRRWKSSR